ncbi:glycosyltransferase family 4 protein [Aeropyrum pernix]|uniref:glycosyltransferase family 4 protein n=1 Tax=Aeropyrum pernix TaxID=56636 RepID=UPI0013F16656|nr:glycosyltransferase family 4 protein [Aeropyrum pernix]
MVAIVVRWGSRIPHLLNYALMTLHSKVDKVFLVIPSRHAKHFMRYFNTFYEYLLDRVVIVPTPFNAVFNSIKWQRDDMPRPYIIAYPEVRCIEKIVQELLREGLKRDEIIFNTTEPFWLGTYVIARNFTSRGIGILTTSSFENVLSPPVKLVWGIVEREVLHQIHVAIAHTFTTKHFLLKLGLSEEKVKVVYPGIDVKLFIPKEHRDSEESITFLFAGRLDPEKGVKELIEAWRKMNVYSSFRLLLAGDGSLRNLVIELAKKHSNVQYLGFVSYKEIPKVYHLGDVFLYLSKPKYLYGMKIGEEQFGFSVVEAMASGLTVVATNTGALPEVIPSPPNYILSLEYLSPSRLSQKLIEIAKSVDRSVLYKNGVFNRVIVEEKHNIWKQSLRLASALVRKW